MTGVILQATYGYSIRQSGPDPIVRLIHSVSASTNEALVPLVWAVDIFPLLRNVPSALASFKRSARKAWVEIERAVEVPYAFVMNRMDSTASRECFVSRTIAHHQGKGAVSATHADDIKWTAFSMYQAGTDTVSSTLLSLVSAMALFPQVQRKAQEEIARVVGEAGLPAFQHREQMPYMQALIKELHRWSPVAPMGLAHLADQDVHCRGYVVPKGSVLLANVWALMHDPDAYANPDAFDPDRFLERNELDPTNMAFGFGRRTCPGRLLAKATLFITAAHMLAMFDVRKALDENGDEVDFTHRHLPGLTGRPAPFPYRIVPRSARHAEIIRGLEGHFAMEGDDDAAAVEKLMSG